MYILITGLSLFWLGLEFESCGCFQIFNIISEFWWGQKNRVSFEKATSFLKGNDKSLQLFFWSQFFFRTVFHLWFSSQSYSYHSIASCLLFKGKEAHFLGYFIVFTFDSFFQEVLLLFFSFLVFFVWKSFVFINTRLWTLWYLM